MLFHLSLLLPSPEAYVCKLSVKLDAFFCPGTICPPLRRTLPSINLPRFGNDQLSSPPACRAPSRVVSQHVGAGRGHISVFRFVMHFFISSGEYTAPAHDSSRSLMLQYDRLGEWVPSVACLHRYASALPCRQTARSNSCRLLRVTLCPRWCRCPVPL